MTTYAKNPAMPSECDIELGGANAAAASDLELAHAESSPGAPAGRLEVARTNRAVHAGKSVDALLAGNSLPSLEPQTLRDIVSGRASPLALLYPHDRLMDTVRAELAQDRGRESRALIAARYLRQNQRLEDDQDVNSETSKDSGNVLARGPWQDLGSVLADDVAFANFGAKFCRPELDRRLGALRQEIERAAADGVLDLIEQRNLQRAIITLDLNIEDYTREVQRIASERGVTVVKRRGLTREHADITGIAELRQFARANPLGAEKLLIEAIQSDKLMPWLNEQDLTATAGWKAAHEVDERYVKARPEEQARQAFVGSWQILWAFGETDAIEYHFEKRGIVYGVIFEK